MKCTFNLEALDDTQSKMIAWSSLSKSRPGLHCVIVARSGIPTVLKDRYRLNEVERAYTSRGNAARRLQQKLRFLVYCSQLLSKELVALVIEDTRGGLTSLVWCMEYGQVHLPYSSSPRRVSRTLCQTSGQPHAPLVPPSFHCLRSRIAKPARKFMPNCCGKNVPC